MQSPASSSSSSSSSPATTTTTTTTTTTNTNTTSTANHNHPISASTTTIASNVLKQLETCVQLGKLHTIDQTDGTTFDGFVHTYDKLSNLLCIELVSTAQIVLLSLYNVKNISSTSSSISTTLPPPTHSNNNSSRKWTHIPQSIDLNKLRNEEDRVFRKRHKEFGQVGLNVSPIAQIVYNTLAKTLPCKWEGDIIVIFDTVRLKHPYNINSITGDGGPAEIERVKLILQNETPSIIKAHNANPNNAPTNNNTNGPSANISNTTPSSTSTSTSTSTPSSTPAANNNTPKSSHNNNNNNNNNSHSKNSPAPTWK